MDILSEVSERIHQDFEARTKARDQALMQARQITRQSANTIRAIHRSEVEPAQESLALARELVSGLKQVLTAYPDLYFAGYTQDAIKEFVEASITCAVMQNQPLPSPEELEVESATYLNGLAEVPGELRRRCMDILRHGYSQEAERLLTFMDDVYSILVTMDYPDAITNGLRRQTDLVRGILERTRSDLTISLREEELKQAMNNFVEKLAPPQ